MQRTNGDYWVLLLATLAWFVGLYLLGAAWWNRPIPRGELLLVQHVGSPIVDMPLVRYGGMGSRQPRGTYRTQDVRLTSAGRHSGTYRPASTLWIDNLDQVSRGQKLNFLVDPGSRLIYEVTADGRVLLDYEETADHRRSAAWRALLFGLGFLAFGSCWIANSAGFGFKSLGLARKKRTSAPP
jgi:hypothetical protein